MNVPEANLLAAQRIDALLEIELSHSCMCGHGEFCERCSSYSAYNQLRDRLKHVSAELQGKPITPPTLADYGATVKVQRYKITQADFSIRLKPSIYRVPRDAKIEDEDNDYSLPDTIAPNPSKLSLVRCIALVEEIRWPLFHAELVDACLDGNIPLKPVGRILWWLDEDLKEHRLILAFDDPKPNFLCVDKPGILVELGDCIGDYKITTYREPGKTNTKP